MGSKTGIAWTDATWNPWQGCTKVSEGCRNCYMYREKGRYGQDPKTIVRSKPNTFNAPLNWAKSGKLPEGSKIFVCSWSDFYHEAADDWRTDAWEMMRSLPQYNFLIPTKRIERYGIEGDGFFIPKNVWLGVSVENQKAAEERIPQLLEIPAAVRWLSVEPMLEKINLFLFPDYDKIDWVVFGGESGPNCRSCEINWLRHGLNQCRAYAVPAFVKQLGGWPDSRHELTDFPEDLQVREFPNVP